MKLINRLERKFGDFAIPNLTLYLIALQTFTFFLAYAYPDFVGKLVLSHDRLFAGEWWRLLTVLFMPPSTYLIFMVFFIFFYYFIGTTLKTQWGTFRYNLYILVGYLGTILAALIPGAVVTNIYLMESVFLAFAWLYPEYPILLFLILPVKVKWLGLAAWIMYLIAFFGGGWDTKAEVVAGALNFAIFFHDDLWQAIRTYPRHSETGWLRPALTIRSRRCTSAPSAGSRINPIRRWNSATAPCAPARRHIASIISITISIGDAMDAG